MIITAALGAIVLNEITHLGRYIYIYKSCVSFLSNVFCADNLNGLFYYIYFSIIGAILIVFGLYTVVWGKSKDLLPNAKAIQDDDKNGPLELPITDSIRSISNNDVDAGVTKIPAIVPHH